MFLAGHAGGALKGHLHMKAADGTPMANMYLTRCISCVGLGRRVR